MFVCVGLSIDEFISSYGACTHAHTGLAVSLMISHAAQLTPLDSRLSTVMHHIPSPGSELVKVARRRGRWREKEVRMRRSRSRRRRRRAEGKETRRNELGREKPAL